MSSSSRCNGKTPDLREKRGGQVHKAAQLLEEFLLHEGNVFRSLSHVLDRQQLYQHLLLRVFPRRLPWLV